MKQFFDGYWILGLRSRGWVRAPVLAIPLGGTVKISIESKLDSAALLTTIKDNISPQGFLIFSTFLGDKAVIGKIRNHKLRLFKRRYYGNSFAPFFFGKVEATSGGSRVVGEFRMHPAVTAFMVLWFSFTAFAFITIASKSSVSSQAGSGHANVMIPASMLLFAVALVWFGKWLARNEGPFIEGFLRSCATGNPVTVDPKQASSLAPQKFWLLELAARRTLALAWDGVVPGVFSIVAFMLVPGRPWVAGCVQMVLWFPYEWITLARFGRGLGKKMAKLRVQSVGGEKMNGRRILIRTSIKMACIAPAYILDPHTYPFIWSVALFGIPYLLTEGNRTLHDLAAGTEVVLAL